MNLFNPHYVALALGRWILGGLDSEGRVSTAHIRLMLFFLNSCLPLFYAVKVPYAWHFPLVLKTLTAELMCQK